MYVVRRFGLVARFAYAMKDNIKKIKNFEVRALTDKTTCFLAPWVPGKSDLGKVLKLRKRKRSLKLCI